MQALDKQEEATDPIFLYLVVAPGVRVCVFGCPSRRASRMIGGMGKTDKLRSMYIPLISIKCNRHRVGGVVMLETSSGFSPM